jgi:dCMP deaminase
MRDVPSWHEYYLGIAHAAAKRSKDPRTQVGSVIVNDDNRIIALGYNGMPEGHLLERSMWDAKDDFVIHAEVNAISNAARTGVSTKDGSIYVTLPPCIACARAIVGAGLRAVVFYQSAYVLRVADKPSFLESYKQSFDYLRGSGVKLVRV